MFIDLVKNKKIAVNLQYENPNEYFCFYSNSVCPQNDNFFVIDFVDGKIYLDRNKELDTHMKLIMDNYSSQL